METASFGKLHLKCDKQFKLRIIDVLKEGIIDNDERYLGISS